MKLKNIKISTFISWQGKQPNKPYFIKSVPILLQDGNVSKNPPDCFIAMSGRTVPLSMHYFRNQEKSFGNNCWRVDIGLTYAWKDHVGKGDLNDKPITILTLSDDYFSQNFPVALRDAVDSVIGDYSPQRLSEKPQLLDQLLNCDHPLLRDLEVIFFPVVMPLIDKRTKKPLIAMYVAIRDQRVFNKIIIHMADTDKDDVLFDF